MNERWKYFVILLLVSYVIISSILLFSQGFLLTKIVQEANSSCLVKLELAPLLNESKNAGESFNENVPFSTNNNQNICTPPLAKIVLLIIDALRYDFTLFNESNVKPLPYQNKLPIIATTLREHPNFTRLYKFIADPPTTTMQRLKALTTGSLPTFIDAGSNFASQEINEDNVIDQINKYNYKTIFLGDDTWISLYPNRFLRKYPYSSFDVWDLDTVDNGIRKHIFQELETTDWNLLIGHFLGVDHCGHRYGPSHDEMTRKLTEMNIVIQQMIDKIDNDTILFVIGDHGMTVTGDHGGESENEIEAAMFIYSKKLLFPFGERVATVKQIDIVPTLSVILGIPIPYQNLGILILDALPLLQNSNYFRLPLYWLWTNVQQIFTYIQSYSAETNLFHKTHLDLFQKKFNWIFDEIHHINSSGQFEEISIQIKSFLLKMRHLCEEVWIQFDNLAINFSLIFLFFALFFVLTISHSIKFQHISYVIKAASVLFTLSLIGILVNLYLRMNRLTSFIFIANILSTLILLRITIQNWNQFSFLKFCKHFGLLNLSSKCILLLNTLSVFSNSFINEESYELFFLLVCLILITFGSIVVFSFEDSKQYRSKKTFIVLQEFLIRCIAILLIILTLLRLSMNFTRCRMEQQWCFTAAYISEVTLMDPKFQWTISSISLILLISSNKIWLKQCGNLSGYTITPFLARTIPFVNTICIMGYWVGKNYLNLGERKFGFLPLSVYFLTMFSVICLVIKPICMSIIWRDNLATDSKNLIPNVYKKLKKSLNKVEDIPVIYGLGTTYSAAYLILLNYLVPLFSLLLSESHACPLLILILLSGVFLIITSILRIRQAENIQDLLNVPDFTIIVWSILSQYFFYATGHQPAFSNIKWDSAFIGTTGLIRHRYILGFLIILNTFNSYILMGFMLPLLIIIPFTLLIMCPSFKIMYNRKRVLSNSIDMKKGEILLYENEQFLSASLFSISCKYIGIHCIKVVASIIAASLHRRHLMVWNIFAPKFIFESIALFTTIFSVILSNLFFFRINFEIKKLFQRMLK